MEQAFLLPRQVRGLSSLLRIRADDSGRVVDVTIVDSSGDPAFDRAAVRAVYRASPLPLPAEAEVAQFFRSFNFRFNPGG